MSFCTTEQIDATTFRCSACGTIYRNVRTGRVIAKCGKPEILPSVTTGVESMLTVVLLGDAVHAIAHATGIARFVSWMEEKTGTACGCSFRWQRMNAWHRRQAHRIGWLVSLPLRLIVRAI